MARPALILALFAAIACLDHQVLGDDELEAAVNEERQPITVDVYYESLCPDSMNFINKQLVPSHPGLKDFISVSLIPFGKASWNEDPSGRPTGFSCQHGPSECRGNQAQSCALHEIDNLYKDDYAAQQLKSIGVIGCVMSSGGSATLVPRCAERNGLSRESVSRIEKCSNNNEGRHLFVENGKRTFEIERPLSFVPTIIINGEKNQDAFNNFNREICNLIPANDRPNACK